MKDRSSEMGNDWREWRQEAKEYKANILGNRSAEIMGLREKGFEVERLTEYQFRVNGRTDIYPVKRRFHDLKTGKRGWYSKLQDLFRYF